MRLWWLVPVMALGMCVSACQPADGDAGMSGAQGASASAQGSSKAAAWVGTEPKWVAINDSTGKSVDLSKEFGKRPIVLVFYRGVW